MKFTKTELDNIKKLSDSIKTKDANYSDLAKLTDEMYKIAKEIDHLRNQYGDLQRKFNEIRTNILKAKDPQGITELKAAVNRKQELDRMVGSRT